MTSPGSRPHPHSHASAQGRDPADTASPGPPSERWPRDFGRDGVSGLATVERAMRARDVSRPGPAERLDAANAIERLLARLDGRR